jgi:hypothetical protein
MLGILPGQADAMSMDIDGLRIWFDVGSSTGKLTVAWRGTEFTTAPISFFVAPPLGALLRGALHIACGGESATMRFESEPYEWRWIVARDFDHHEWRKSFSIRILGFDSYYDSSPDSAGVFLFSAEPTADEFVRAVADLGQRLWESAGSTYREASLLAEPVPGPGFPLRALRALQAALESDDEFVDRATLTSVTRII